MKASFSLLIASLLMVSAVGCSSAPKQEEAQQSADVTSEVAAFADAESSEDTTSIADTMEPSSSESETSAREAFLEPIADETEDATSLGSGSSGRGH